MAKLLTNGEFRKYGQVCLSAERLRDACERKDRAAWSAMGIPKSWKSLDVIPLNSYLHTCPIVLCADKSSSDPVNPFLVKHAHNTLQLRGMILVDGLSDEDDPEGELETALILWRVRSNQALQNSVKRAKTKNESN